MKKKFDVWNDQYDDKGFPTVSDDFFKIKDKNTIKELANIMHTPETTIPDMIKGTETFSQKSHNVFDALDNYKKEHPTPVSNQWNYYSLEDVETDDAKTLTNAYDFLDELKKRNAPPGENMDAMDTEFKPTFRVKEGKMKMEKDKKAKAMMEPSKLSFGDDF
jgi:hypothetical protein